MTPTPWLLFCAAAFVGAGRAEAVAAELRQHLTEAPLRYAGGSDEAAAEAMLAQSDALAVRCLHAARAAEVVACNATPRRAALVRSALRRRPLQRSAPVAAKNIKRMLAQTRCVVMP